MKKRQVITPKRFSGRYWLRLGLFSGTVLTLATLFLLTYFIHLQVNAFVTPHRNSNIGTPSEITTHYEDITLTTSDKLFISGWYFPGTQSKAIILVHGIDGNRKNVLPEAAVLLEAGYHVVLIDLRGHGQSEGTENSYGYREALDVQAAVDYVLAKPGVKQVGVLGTSLGGAAAVRAAAIDPRVRAVVVESSFSSLHAAVDDAFDDRSVFPKWPFAPLLVSLAERRVGMEITQVDSARDLATIHPRPVMIIHGTADNLFPLYHAQRMYAAAQDPKELWIIEGLGHASPVVGREAAYKERVVTFFERAFAQ